MNRVVKILMERDGVSEQDAIELVKEAKEEILSSDPIEADDIMADLLCLEPDYIFDVIYLM